MRLLNIFISPRLQNEIFDIDFIYHLINHLYGQKQYNLYKKFRQAKINKYSYKTENKKVNSGY
jgi:hypothetical protein